MTNKLFSDDFTSKKENQRDVLVHNQPFVNFILADGNPNYQFLREALKNMIEAQIWFLSNGKQTLKNPTEMYIRALPLKGVKEYLDWVYSGDDSDVDADQKESFTAPKLSFLNLKGLTPDQLEVATSISGSVDKEQSLEENFGMGIITTVTGFSDLMMISRYNGETYATVVGFRNQVLKRILPVTKFTDWVKGYEEERGYDRYGDADFTEVIILGKKGKINQNTFQDPYGQGDKMPDNWILSTLFTRFATLPNNINLIFEGWKSNKRSKSCKVHAMNEQGSSNYTFRTFNDLIPNFKTKNSEFKIDTITLPDGGEIDYIYDAPCNGDKGGGRPTSRNSSKKGFDAPFSALEFKCEYYDIHGGTTNKSLDHFGGTNKKVMSNLGVIEGSEYFRVIYRLPTNLYKNDYTRTSIVEKNSNFGTKINLIDKISDIYSNRPQWFVQKISEHNTNVTEMNFEDEITKMLQEYFSDDQDVNLRSNVKGSSTWSKPEQKDTKYYCQGNNKGQCKNQGIKTEMKKGQKVCSVCGWERKKSENKPDNQNLNGKQTMSISMPIPKVKFINHSKELGSDIAEYKISPDPKDSDEIVINENHRIITEFVDKYTDVSEIREKVRVMAKNLIGQYIAFTACIGLIHKNKSGGNFTFTDFENWINNRSLNLYAKQARMIKEAELKKYIAICNKEEIQSNQSNVFINEGSESNTSVINKREYDASKGLPINTNIKGETIS